MLNNDFMSKMTMVVAMDNDKGITSGQGNQAVWVEVKTLMLKHFLPEDYMKLQHIKVKIK
jgi:hypothetical protein